MVVDGGHRQAQPEPTPSSPDARRLHDAGPDEVRFAELRRRMPGISQKMLSQTLSNLVADGLVARRVEPVVPPAVHYSLTPLGRSLALPLETLREWAEANMAQIVDRRAGQAVSGT